jgi:hypothetical protein
MNSATLGRIAPSLLLVAFACAATGDARSAAAIQAAGDAWTEKELARESFSNASWRERWLVEGDGEFSLRDGRLHVATSQATIWWRTPLPDDVAVTMTAAVDPPAQENAANLNLFFHARELDGSPYRFGRSPAYDEYQRIPNYIATLTGGFQDGWSRLRRDPGFELLSEDHRARSDVGRTYRIRVMIAAGRIRYWLDGKLIHDVRDPKPLPGGHFALRTWRSRVWWSDIRFAALERRNAYR